MRSLPVQGAFLEQLRSALGRAPLFAGLAPAQLQQIVERAKLIEIEAGEALVEQGDPPSGFDVLLAGEALVRMQVGDEAIEVGRLGPADTVGEMGLLLDQPRSASVIAAERLLAARFDAETFPVLFDRVDSFGLAIARALARRVRDASRRIPIPDYDAAPIHDEVRDLLPLAFLERHRVLPLRMDDRALTLGFVDDPTPAILGSVRKALPGVTLRPVRIASQIDEALRQRSGIAAKATDEPAEPDPDDVEITQDVTVPAHDGLLEALLRRVVAEGASDLHLAAGQRPRWRIDGEIHEVEDAPKLGREQVLELLEPVMEPRHREEFGADQDTDFAHALPDGARFRVNLFRDARGVGAVLRQVPRAIPSLEQLGLPPAIAKLCDHPKGLVLVTGPTGSGKSTTLAAMIDRINRTRRAHIVTLEDPIEFLHDSRLALINQREVGAHTKSFARALRAALREDPNIVLVGEMRDLETVSLALETAATGHLVFATLHTSTAIGTVDRIIDLFPADQQNKVRATLADVLRGVIAQTLLKQIGGGRIAALEVLIVNAAVSNLIRNAKTHQIMTLMQTGKAQGNLLLNDQLAALVGEGKVSPEEALAKALDKSDLAARIGRASDET